MNEVIDVKYVDPNNNVIILFLCIINHTKQTIVS